MRLHYLYRFIRLYTVYNIGSSDYTVQAGSQPARWGGVWTWMGGTPGAPPPLDIVRVTSSALRKIDPPPLLDIHKHHPPPWTLPVWRHPHSKSKGGGGGDRSVPVTHTLHRFAKGWNKIAKGWDKIAKGWNKFLGMGNWGGVRPPLATGLLYRFMRRTMQ